MNASDQTEEPTEQTGNVTMENSNGIIYVEVPHQLPAKAYAFFSEEDLMNMLRAEARCVSRETFTLDEWKARCEESGEEEGSEWWTKWAKPGFDLFDKGAEKIVEISTESSCDLYPESEAPSEFQSLMDAVNDFHAHYTLNREEALKVLSGERKIHQHQEIRTRYQIEEAARQLDWIE